MTVWSCFARFVFILYTWAGVVHLLLTVGTGALEKGAERRRWRMCSVICCLQQRLVWCQLSACLTSLQRSALLIISQSASYVVNADDLQAVTFNNQLIKLADDTYLVISTSNVDTRSTEIDNIQTWAQENNLTLNRTKTKEIVFVDTNRRRQVAAPLALRGIDHVTSLKILGVTMTNGLSASDHFRHIISDCAQTLCTTSLACPRHVWHHITGHLQIGRRRQATVCIQRMGWIYYSRRSAASRHIPLPQHPLRILSLWHSTVRESAQSIWRIALRQSDAQQTPFAVQIPPTSVSSPTELPPATSNTQ